MAETVSFIAFKVIVHNYKTYPMLCQAPGKNSLLKVKHCEMTKHINPQCFFFSAGLQLNSRFAFAFL